MGEHAGILVGFGHIQTSTVLQIYKIGSPRRYVDEEKLVEVVFAILRDAACKSYPLKKVLLTTVSVLL